MRARAKVKIAGRFDGAGSATVRITLNPDLIAVRPYRRQRWYELSLERVARGIIYDVVKAEVAQRRKEKKKARAHRQRP